MNPSMWKQASAQFEQLSRIPAGDKPMESRVCENKRQRSLNNYRGYAPYFIKIPEISGILIKYSMPKKKVGFY